MMITRGKKSAWEKHGWIGEGNDKRKKWEGKKGLNLGK